MLKIPPHVETAFITILEENGVKLKSRPRYLKWLRYYLDYCEKYQFDSQSNASLAPFVQRLSQKKQTEQQQQQACQDIQFFHQMARLPRKRKPAPGETKTTFANPLQGVRGAENMVREALPAVPGTDPFTVGSPGCR